VGESLETSIKQFPNLAILRIPPYDIPGAKSAKQGGLSGQLKGLMGIGGLNGGWLCEFVVAKPYSTTGISLSR